VKPPTLAAPVTDAARCVVTPITDGGAVVRGTDDVETAREALIDHYEGEDDDYGDVMTLWGALGRALYARVVRVGWFRWNPCCQNTCWEDFQHRPGHLDYRDGPGRGRWQGVLFE
jgi:hypothetical protein